MKLISEEGIFRFFTTTNRGLVASQLLYSIVTKAQKHWRLQYI